MSKLINTEIKVFSSEKEVNAFFKSGEVGEIIGLYLKKNESYVLFYLKDEPLVDKKNDSSKKELRKG